jgi:hypothetical protein
MSIFGNLFVKWLQPLKTEVAWRNRNTNENSQNNASRWPAKEINMPEDNSFMASFLVQS